MRNRCSCTQRDVNKYLSKISGPILDRFDLCVYLNRVEYKDIKKKWKKLQKRWKKRVIAAAQIQRERYKNETVSYNGQLDGRNIKEFCKLNKPEEELMEQIEEDENLEDFLYELDIIFRMMLCYEKFDRISGTRMEKIAESTW